ncbi:FG-GAP repeat domain-containing protein [Streptomyces sp. NPDC058877]|uniref:FG-GAP repeat domain-containing protein n=1 Tax=Streptomyces sp. NPDC058877 TaxID=3346665 RepID=UPI0036BC9A6B
MGVALTVTVGTLAVPALAAPAVAATAAASADGASVAAATEAAPVPYPLDSTLWSAGATGFLTGGPGSDGHEYRWTRYADGSSTVLPHLFVQGSRGSDVVVFGDGFNYTLRDMATGADLLAVDLRTVGTAGADYSGVAGATLFATTSGTTGEDLHLLTRTDGEPADRTVTGLPADATRVRASAVPSEPGRALLTYQSGGKRYWALLDLATGAATDHREIVTTGQWGGWPTLSKTHVAWVEYDSSSRASVVVVERGTGKTQRVPLGTAGRVSVGLVGDWVTYAEHDGLGAYEPNPLYSLTARSLTTGTTRKLLDHVKGEVSGPDGTQLVRGGTAAQGEGLYRIRTGADGVPVAEPAASTGEPTKVTLLGHEVPSVINADPAEGPVRLDWRLSRTNVAMAVTLRHVQSGETKRADVYPSGDLVDDPHIARLDWNGDVDLNGERGTPTGAPSGAYTWEIKAKPLNGIGPDLVASGTFTLTREPAPHDYDDDGSPDVLRRDGSGRLWMSDTYYAYDDLTQYPEKLVGWGWNVYDQIEAVGDVAGASVGDLVARDGDGVLWEYLGKGDGTFAPRTRIGGGWQVYNKITGGSDLDGDGRSDLLATDASGGLWFYKGTGDWRAPFAPRVKIGWGWGVYNQITAVGDVAGASAGDLVARDGDGVLWLYLGKGDGTFAQRTKIGGGWNAYTHLVGIGDADRDGRNDLYASGSRTGSSYLYQGTGGWRAPFRSREAVAEHFWEYRTYNLFI